MVTSGNCSYGSPLFRIDYSRVSRLGRLVNVSVKVPEEIKELMRKVDVNWSEYLRETIEAKIRAEMAKDATRRLDEIRRRAGKVPTEEIVRWMREDREISGHLKTQRRNRNS